MTEPKYTVYLDSEGNATYDFRPFRDLRGAQGYDDGNGNLTSTVRDDPPSTRTGENSVKCPDCGNSYGGSEWHDCPADTGLLEQAVEALWAERGRIPAETPCQLCGVDYGYVDGTEHRVDCMRYRETTPSSARNGGQDVVNEPGHYKFPNGAEVIDITRHLPFCEGNAVKYLTRAGRKAGNSRLQDLRKAEKYVKWAIENAEQGAEK